MGSSKPPIFSVLVPVYHPDPVHLREAISSVWAQTTSEWELILVCDGPQPDEVMAEMVTDDPRIRVIERPEQGGITAASAAALAAASGEFIALLDNDDALTPEALGACAWEIDRWDDVDVLYTDEDKLDPDGRRRRPFFKPGWSPERLRSQMYVSHLGVYRRTLVEEVGGFRPGYDGSQDHDLALRVTEKARRIVHVPRIFYHWREAETSTAFDPSTKDWAFEAGVRAVQSHLERTEIPATAVRHPRYNGVIRIQPHQDFDFGKVSIIIPTSGSSKLVDGREIDLVDNAIRSIVRRSSYANYEIVVVLDRHGSAETADRILSVAPGSVRLVQDWRDFNFSSACNLGAGRADGDILLFLNDDTEVITTDWLERLAMHATLPGAGAVGARLNYPDGRIQHGGVQMRYGGAGHSYRGVDGDHPGYYAELAIVRNTSAVTGACLALTTAHFEEVGGFCNEFPLSYNDVDLCLKLLAKGYRNIMDSDTQLIHYESASRDPVVMPWEAELVKERWWSFLHHDPYVSSSVSSNPHTYPNPPDALVKLRELEGPAPMGRSWPLEEPTLFT